MFVSRSLRSSVLVLCALLLAVGLAGQAVPIAPTLISPAHQAMDVATSGDLSWRTVPDAQEYQVQLAYSMSAIQGIRYQYNHYSFSCLRYKTRYSWRVRAFDQNGNAGPWSSVWYFTTTATVPPNTPSTAPILMTPAEGITGVETSPTLTWTPVPGATHYSIAISTHPNLGNAGNRDGLYVKGNVADTSWKVPALFGSTRYYWRVYGTINGLPGPYSDIRSFTTAASTETIPPKPVLVFPAEGETNLSRSLKARWQGQQAAYFRLQFATKDAGEKDEWLDAGSQLVGEYPFINLQPNTCYYWRVRSMNSAGASEWTTGSFTTGTE